MTGTMQGQSHPAEPAEENQIVGEGRKLGRQDQEPGNTSWVASQSRSASNIFLHLCIQILYTLEISHLSLSGRMMFIKSRIGADVFVDLILKNLKRPHWLENNLVELPDVEVVPQRLLGPLPQLEDLNLAHLVGCGLAWPGDVAGDLRPGNDHDKAPWGLSPSFTWCPPHWRLCAPTCTAQPPPVSSRMHASQYPQLLNWHCYSYREFSEWITKTTSTKYLFTQVTKSVQGIFVSVDIESKSFRIQPPTLNISGVNGKSIKDLSSRFI